MAARETRTGRAKGKHPKPPDETPRADEQSNLSDPDSRLIARASSTSTARPITLKPWWMPGALS